MNEWFAAPAAFLAEYPAFRALDPGAQQELAQALEPVELAAGAVLFAPGDPRDAIFFILCGSMSLAFEPSATSAKPTRMLGPGEAVGEIGLPADGPYTSTARALDDTLVLRLSRLAYERMREKHPEAVSGLTLAIAPAARKMLLASLLADLVGELDTAHRGAIVAQMDFLELKAGDVLFRKGEVSDHMFLIIYGRLRLVTECTEGIEMLVDEAGRGDTLGQRSLLAGEPHSTTAYALRDSAVCAIPRSLVETLQYEYPEVVERFTRVAARRRQAFEWRRPPPPDAPHIVSVAVVPVGAPRGRVPLAPFTEALVSTISEYGSTLHLTSARVDELLGTPGIAQVSHDDPSGPVVSGWLEQQELSHLCVIYEADDAWTPWTERCLRRSDRVILVGWGAAAPVPTELDQPIARLSDSTKTVLALLQPDDIVWPSGAAAWLDRYAVAGHGHVCMRRTGSFDRFLRHISARGLGLVLGGGAARGFAHIGVFRAIQECGVDVDVCGGTSMGAVLGAMFAMGFGHKEVMRLAKAVASPLKLFDLTMPVVSFFESEKVTRVLRSIFDDRRIEDLWLPFFCVSSNLTRAVTMVHRRGPLWHAVRASMAIPGVFSPVLADGDLLVDGCVLDNLPIDVMQRVNFGGPMIAVNVFPDVDMLRDYDFGPSVSGWQALAGKLNPFRRREGAPLIFESLVRVLALNGVHQAKAQRSFAEVYIRPPVEQFNILDFGAYRQIAEIGYQSAMEALQDWQAARNGGTGRQIAAVSPVPTAACAPTAPRLARGNSVTAPLHKTLADLEALLGG